MIFGQSIPHYRHTVFNSQRHIVPEKYQNGDMEKLSERLKKARNDAGLTQEELARKAGLKRQSIVGGLESGDQKTSAYLPQIANVLGVNALWLAVGKGPQKVTDAPPPEAKQSLDPHFLHRSLLGVAAYLRKRKRTATDEERVELACFIYEMFHDQADVTEEKMVLWIEKWLDYGLGKKQ